MNVPVYRACNHRKKPSFSGWRCEVFKFDMMKFESNGKNSEFASCTEKSTPDVFAWLCGGTWRDCICICVRGQQGLTSFQGLTCMERIRLITNCVVVHGCTARALART